MTVYVDDAIHRFGRMRMCHMWADTVEELLAMADRIEVARKWIQGHPTLSHGKHREASWVHFDIAKSKRELALKAGAIATDRYGPVEHTARLDVASGDPARATRGETMLARVAAIREQRTTQPTSQGSLL